jgi:MoaA/NifB/PqqE/SkfB family radical SAM enzyme
MLKLLTSIPLYHSMRRTGWPRLLPLNVTVSVTYRCNSRCLTCNVYNRKADEFTVEEFDRTFASMGKTPYWFTMSGGEPFLRRDLVDICESAWRRTRPAIINIPTNGILTDRIPTMVEEIAARCPGTEVIINLSLDDIGQHHDLIRGVPGNFEKAIGTYNGLRNLKADNLTLGIHTVISVHNVERLPKIYEYVTRELAPDSFITEIAEERVELDTVGSKVTPAPADYAAAVDFLTARLHEQRFRGISRVTQSFRARYYGLVKRFLNEHRQIIPCYAGFASGQIAPDGDVWFCCIEARSVGNLRDSDYDFPSIWFGERAQALRNRVRTGACSCPLANAGYTNMLMHVPTLAAVGWEIVTRQPPGGKQQANVED